MRENVERSAHSTETPVARLTEKDHIIQNVCSTFDKEISHLDNFLVMETIWNILMGDCMWAEFC